MNTERVKAVSIIGAGSWGTAIANVIANAHESVSVKMWAYEKNVVSSINHYHENSEFLPGVPLSYKITATGSIKEACSNADILIIATPSKVIPDITQKMNRYVTEKTCLGFLTKGFCKIQDKVLTISQTIEWFMPKLSGRIVAISGPSHAEEVSKNFHTCLNVAGRYVPNRKLFCFLLTDAYTQCRESDDIAGVEVGGTLKNPAAIAAGMISMLPGCGDNLAGALIAEAMKEMIRLGRYFNAKDDTIIDISGLGDLVATSLSNHSRNRRFGQDIAKQFMDTDSRVGFKDRIMLRFNPKVVIEKMNEKMNYLAEGAYAIEPLIELARDNDIPVPVYRSLYEVLLNKKDPALLIETIKNPVRFEEIYSQTKIHITEKKRGLEKIKGRVFRHFIIARVTDNLFGQNNNLLNDKLIEKLSSYRTLLDEAPENYEEKLLLDRIISSPVKERVEDILQMYLSSMSDNYTSMAARIFMFLIRLGRFWSSSLFKRKKIFIEGNISQLRSFCDLGTIIYILDGRSLFDFIPLLRSIKKIKMPVPRFMVASTALSGRFESSFVRLAGGFIFDENRYANPLYRYLFFAYLSTMVENGVPLLLYRTYSDVRMPETILQIIKKSMVDRSVEILISPVSISRINDDFPKKAGLLPLLKHLRGGMIHRFSDFIFLSEFTKENIGSGEILPSIEATFKNDKPCYSHILMAKVFWENKNSISKKNLESATKEIIDSAGMSVNGKLRNNINNGMVWLRKKKIIKKTGKYYVISNMEEAKRLADLF
ncbi:MAG: NAD(P)-binding domain-containing protein [Leptospirales bacterium]|nr:NAD(P)-binding domain-containing protein [Leptospirales bacterium]